MYKPCDDKDHYFRGAGMPSRLENIYFLVVTVAFLVWRAVVFLNR